MISTIYWRKNGTPVLKYKVVGPTRSNGQEIDAILCTVLEEPVTSQDSQEGGEKILFN